MIVGFPCLFRCWSSSSCGSCNERVYLVYPVLFDFRRDLTEEIPSRKDELKLKGIHDWMKKREIRYLIIDPYDRKTVSCPVGCLEHLHVVLYHSLRIGTK